MNDVQPATEPSNNFSMIICMAITLFISGICILGDYFLKKASQMDSPFTTWQFLIGATTFALTAIGWVIIFPHMKLAAVGVVYGVSTVLLMAALGWLVFDEHLNGYEITGIVLGVASIGLLAKFSD